MEYLNTVCSLVSFIRKPKEGTYWMKYFYLFIAVQYTQEMLNKLFVFKLTLL